LAFTSSAVTVNGFGDYNSGDFTPSAVGTYYWIASYSGDNNYGAASTSCGDANESSVVNPVQPAIVTNADAGPVNIGQTIHDTATLSGGSNPTGTITFSLYGPFLGTTDSTSCTAQKLITTYQVTVNGNGTYSSPAYTTTAAGKYLWIAAYGGDNNNNSATTACNDAFESSVVQPNSPALSTAPTVKVIHSDSATLSGGASPTGSITFNLYQNTTCTGSPAFTATKTVSGNATYTSGDSQQFTLPPPASTEFRWTVSYSGDANNNAASSACGAENVTINITHT